MKKTNARLVLFIGLGAFLIGGCGVSPSIISPTPPCEYLDIQEIPLTAKQLINTYLYLPTVEVGRHINRWDCGEIFIYDETNYFQIDEILLEINNIIDGPIKLKLTKSPDQAKIKIIFGSTWIRFDISETFEIKGATIEMPPLSSRGQYIRSLVCTLLFPLKLSEEEREELGAGVISESIKIVLYYVYRIPIGASLPLSL